MPDLPQRNETLTLEDLGDGESLLYDPATGDVHVLNRTARLVWELCDGAHTLDEIVATVERRFRPPTGRDVAADIRRLVADLRAGGLLTPA